jgi:hypothetical protein
MKTNTATQTSALRTHEGGRAGVQSPLQELTRAVSTCMLFENTFYESGSDIAQRIRDLSFQVPAQKLSELAVIARRDLKLRHVPLFLIVQLAKMHGVNPLLASTIRSVVRRPDEMGELLSLYWLDNPRRAEQPAAKMGGPMPSGMKRGLAAAFNSFNEYQLAKWNRDSRIKLLDVMRLVHPVPKDAETAALFGRLRDNKLESPKTWENRLSAGADKKASWEELLREKQLGYMALLMNMRNMHNAGVDQKLVETALLEGARGSWALPYRFVTAARHAPWAAQALSDAMLLSLTSTAKLPGKTALLVDLSQSMDAAISQKSEVSRWHTAGALAILLREVCDQVRIFGYSTDFAEVGNFRGLPLIDALGNCVRHGNTMTAMALDRVKTACPDYDRVILITDEQAHDGIIPNWTTKSSYVVNVAPYQPGLITTGNGWERISGWSERLVDWIQFEESGSLAGVQPDSVSEED